MYQLMNFLFYLSSIIMTKAIADRLAEAFAEHLHERVRKEFWGYSNEESLKEEDLLKVKYQVNIIYSKQF